LQLRALAIYESVRGPDHPDTASSLNDLARIYKALAQYDKALSSDQRALAIYQKVLGPWHSDTARSLNNLAAIYSALGQHEKALLLDLRALAIWEKVHGPKHPKTAISLNNLAETYSALAQYEKALPLQLRALAIREKVLGLEHPDTALSLNNLGSTYAVLAQHDKALPLELRALAIREKVLGPEHPDTAQSLNNLAATYSALGEHDKALPLDLRALAIREKAHGPEHPETAQSINNLAVTYSALAQHGKVLPLQQRALDIREKTLGPDHPDTAQTLHNLAGAYSELAQFDRALQLQLRALAIYEKALGLDHPYTARSLNNLGTIHLKLAQPDLAVAYLKSSVNAYQVTRERLSRIGFAELRSYTESVSGTYQKLASVLTDQGRLAEAQMVLDMLKEEEQFDFIRRSAGADPRRTRIGYTPTEERWMSRYREIADRLAALGREEQALQKQAKLGLSEEQKKRQAVLTADLKVAQAAFESFLEQMRQEFAAKGAARSVEFAESSVKALAELQDLLKGLGDDVALLRIYLTDEQVNFLFTTPGVQLARNVKIKTQDLNRQVAELNRLLRNPKSNPLPAAQALYKLLLAPVEQDLQQAGAKTVMLSLDGVLRYVPFGVLHDGQRYALQRWNLPVYTSVVRDRLRDAANAKWQAAGLGVTRKHGNFDPLPAVRTEMSSIIRTGTTGVLPGEVHLDEAFTAQRLKDVSQRRFPVVHVASHFQFSPGTEVNSFLLLGDGKRLTLGDIRTQNYRFDDVDLLTLSACETGLGGGRDQRGREIEGFGVIAQQQGAQAVLATLWKVADGSTATLMGDMYRRRTQSGLSKIEALRQAQVALAAQPRTSHPFFWAPFVLMGNWK
jgi:CHAT domain-containing protein